MSTITPLKEKAELVLSKMSEAGGLSDRSATALYEAVAAAVGFVHLANSKEHSRGALEMYKERKVEPNTNGNIHLPAAKLLFWNGKGDKPSGINKWAKAIRTCIDARKPEEEVVEFIRAFKYNNKRALAAVYEYDTAQYPNNSGAQGRTANVIREIKAEIGKEVYGEIARPSASVTELESLCILVGEITGDSIIVRGVYTGDDDIAPVIKKFKPAEAQKKTASMFAGLANAFDGEPAARQEA